VIIPFYFFVFYSLSDIWPIFRYIQQIFFDILLKSVRDSIEKSISLDIRLIHLRYSVDILDILISREHIFSAEM